MEENINIFDSAAPKGEFVKFSKVGDSIQGTYIDRYDGTDSYKNEQTIVVLKDKDNKIWNVGIKKTNAILIENVDRIKFGQIVGFRYEGDKESKRYPGKNAKMINVYSDPTKVDTKWLSEQSGATQPKVKEDVPFGSKTPNITEVEDLGKDPIYQAIRTLAITKGLTNASMSLADQDATIIGYTSYKYDGTNGPLIITALSSYRQ